MTIVPMIKNGLYMMAKLPFSFADISTFRLGLHTCTSQSLKRQCIKWRVIHNHEVSLDYFDKGAIDPNKTKNNPMILLCMKIENDGAAFVCSATLSSHRRAWARGDAILLVESGGWVLYSNVLTKVCIYRFIHVNNLWSLFHLSCSSCV